MNDQTAAVIHGLANKLGTTSEYLWAVLIKQAPIAGTVLLVEYALTVVVIALAWRFRLALFSFTQERLDDYNEGRQLLMFISIAIFMVVSVIWLLACLFNISTVVTAFLNPEYWALKEVLSAIATKK